MRTRHLTSPSAIAAIASPARQELLGALGDGPASVRELAARLGRSRQALHHHIAALVSAGLVRASGTRGRGVRKEQVYALEGERIAVRSHGTSRKELEVTTRALQALLRLTGREAGRALTTPGLRRSGAARELVALRGKVRLSPERLGRLNALIEELQQVLRDAKADRTDPLYAVTLVLTPSPDRSGAHGMAARAVRP
jgi:DNA-binding transcriptional ArsR family regulator